MSREIDLTKPLSDEDREYLVQRNRTQDIERADAVADGEDPADIQPPLPPEVTGIPHSVDQTPQAEPASALGQEREREAALEPERQASEDLIAGLESTEVVGEPSVGTAEAPAPAEPAADADNYDDKDAWSFNDLRDEARTRDLPTGGDREEIITRLRADDSKES